MVHVFILIRVLLSIIVLLFVECPQLTLDKGTIIGNQRVLGSKVKISCDSEYLEVENMTYATCNSTGEWSYKPRCIAGKITAFFCFIKQIIRIK